MQLRKILKEIKGIAVDSRQVKKDFLFIALKGQITDGHNYIRQAINNGAKAVILEDKSYIDKASCDIAWILSKDSKKALVEAASKFYSFPKEKIKLLAVTGTNGKTTITYLLEKIFSSKYNVGVIGTIDYHFKGRVFESRNTTPGFIDLQKMIYQMYQEGVNAVAMEVSSHALDQNRTEGFNFDCAIFTNLTGEHLDYHKNMQNYFSSKAKLFSGLKKDSVAVINTDSLWGKKLVNLTKAKVITYGFNKADIFPSNIKMSLTGLKFAINYNKLKINVNSPLIGRHNIYNILAAASCGISQNININATEEALRSLKSVSGRLEPIDLGQPFKVYIDYAHTPDALENVISSLNCFKKKRLILVFGCGGDRDKIKRSKMGSIASRLADFTIISSDNPRSEDPQKIADDIKKGIKNNNYSIVLDRYEAIKKAINLAKKDDIVLVCGKGHECTQIFKDRAIEFSDQKVTRCLLSKKF